MFCRKCGNRIDDDSAFCHYCGERTLAAGQNYYQNTPEYENVSAAAKMRKGGNQALDKMTEKLNSLAGGEGSVQLKVKDLFTDVFRKHEKEEADRILIWGTESTTPDMTTLDVSWPKPWLYSRIFLVLFISFALMYLCCVIFNNPNCLPGVIFLGSFSMPVTLLFMFYEMNVPRNISFFNTLKIFLIGGCASLFITLILYTIFDYGSSYLEALVVGLVEEIGKLIMVAAFINHEKNAKYLFSGLLIGAAVGAGFAAFETAGYAFRYYEALGFSSMLRVLFLRGFLAPGNHVAWAAVSGFAITHAKGNQTLKFDHFYSQRFLKLFWIPVVLHCVWDMPIPFGSSFHLVQIILTVVSWIVLLVLINSSFSQINEKVLEARTMM